MKIHFEHFNHPIENQHANGQKDYIEAEEQRSLHHIEQEAEALATLLYVRIFMAKTLIPLSARSIHERGYIQRFVACPLAKKPKC